MCHRQHLAAGRGEVFLAGVGCRLILALERFVSETIRKRSSRITFIMSVFVVDKI